MPQHPEAYSPARQVAQQLATLTERVRRLEARRSSMAMAITPAVPQSTTSRSAIPLWQVSGPLPAGWQITVIVAVGLDTVDAHGGLELRDATGHGVASVTARDGQIVTLTCQDAPMPLTLYGYASAGTLFTTVNEAESAPWAGSTDGN